MVKIVGLCLVTLCITSILEKENRSISLLAKIFAGVLVCIAVFPQLSSIAENMYTLCTRYGAKREEIYLLGKVVAISFLASFAKDMCKDSGNTFLANKVEFAGKVTLLALAMPHVFAALEICMEMV